jgi:hypothetical protein
LQAVSIKETSFDQCNVFSLFQPITGDNVTFEHLELSLELVTNLNVSKWQFVAMNVSYSATMNGINGVNGINGINGISGSNGSAEQEKDVTQERDSQNSFQDFIRFSLP